jgi:hypothetical protein
MTKTTVSAAGGAMPKIDRAALMTPSLGNLPADLSLSADQVFGHQA